MADTKPGTVPLTAEDLAAELERKQAQRGTIALVTSVVVNVLFLVGAANGMAQQDLRIDNNPPANPIFFTIASPAPSPAATPAAVPTPVPTPPGPKLVAQRQKKTPRRRVRVAQVRPRLLVAPRFEKPVVRATPPPPPDEQQPKPQETPPPTKAVESTVANQDRAQQQRANQGRSEETRAANKNTNSALAANEMDSSASARNGVESIAPRRGGGSSSQGGEPGSGGSTARLGTNGGSTANGLAGVTGVTRDTNSLNGANGSVDGPKLSASTGPTLGGSGGPAGARNTILMDENVGGNSTGEFTVAQGSGIRPGAIVSKTGTAAGGSAGIKSNMTAGPRYAGGGNAGGSGGAESLGGSYRPSTGPGGGGRGPVGFGGVGGAGARGGDGPLGGSAGGDLASVTAAGRGGGLGTGNGRGGRTSGIAGAGNGNGGSGGGTRAGNGNGGNGDSGDSGRGRGIGNGNGPGRGKGGPTGTQAGIGTGNGTGTKLGSLGTPGGTGVGPDVGRGTGTAGKLGRADVQVKGSGNGGADIVSTKVGVKENDKGVGPLVVKGDEKKPGRPSGEVKGEGLTKDIDTSSKIEAKTEAHATSRPRPIITEEMLADNPKVARVRFTIYPNGSSDCEIVASSGNSDVDAAILKACRGYRWSPATADGKPVKTNQEVRFDPKDFR